MTNEQVTSLLKDAQKLWITWKDVPLTLYGSKEDWDKIMSTASQIIEEHGNTERVFNLVNFFMTELHQRAEQREER